MGKTRLLLLVFVLHLVGANCLWACVPGAGRTPAPVTHAASMPNCHMDSSENAAQLTSGACPFSQSGHETLNGPATTSIAQTAQSQTFSAPSVALLPALPASLANMSTAARAGGPGAFAPLSLPLLL